MKVYHFTPREMYQFLLYALRFTLNSLYVYKTERLESTTAATTTATKTTAAATATTITTKTTAAITTAIATTMTTTNTLKCISSAHLCFFSLSDQQHKSLKLCSGCQNVHFTHHSMCTSHIAACALQTLLDVHFRHHFMCTSDITTYALHTLLDVRSNLGKTYVFINVNTESNSCRKPISHSF